MRPGPPPLRPFCSSRVNVGGLNFARLRDTEEDTAAEVSVNELKEVKLKKWKEMVLDSGLLNTTAVEHSIEEKYLEDHIHNGEIFTDEEIERQPPLALGHYRKHSPNHYVASAIHLIKLTGSSSD